MISDMDRLFRTHEIRRSRECAPLWTLTTPDAGGLDRPETVVVPGVWESHPALRGYRGRGVYEQAVSCGGNVRFLLGGVSFAAKVYLDGELLCEHYGAYTAFEAIARNVAPGRHTLRVEADNRFGKHSALHVPKDYYAYGGIHRPVLVEELDSAYIVSCLVTPVRTPEGWRADCRVSVRNLCDRQTEAAVCVSVAGQQAKKTVPLPADGSAQAELSCLCPDVCAWSPEAPCLYTVCATLLIDGQPMDDLIDRIGFRDVRTEGNRILLNGEPLRLRGFNRHEEYGGFGLAVPLEAMMQDIQLMRDMGANCVRTCHYPNDPRFLDLCDELGMLVWEESHVRGFDEQRMRHPLFMPQLRRCTREMVEQHYNHPSVFIWASLNECADDTAYGAACYREIYSLLRELDGSRPVTAALLERPGGRVFGDCDAVSVNLYPRWYHDTPVQQALDRKLAEISAGGGGEKPVIVSEIGAGAIYGFHDPFGRDKWSEERQADILREQITEVLRHPDLCGILIWQFADVRVDENWAVHRPKTRNNKGVVDEYRRPKLAYAVVKELFETME